MAQITSNKIVNKKCPKCKNNTMQLYNKNLYVCDICEYFYNKN